MQTTTPAASTSTVTAVLRRAASQAVKAPSVHNTQPWRLVLRDDHLDIRVDPARRLEVLDPRGRQLMISCGCALLNARVSVAASGFDAVVERFAPPGVGEIVARLRLGEAREQPSAAELDAAIGRRRTNRRPFLGEALTAADTDRFIEAARAEGVDAVCIARPEQRRLIAELLSRAARLEAEDPAYLKELLDWTTDDPRRADGVQASSVPYAGPADTGITGTGVNPAAVRKFDFRGMGWLPSAAPLADECLLLFCTEADDGPSWLAAGEALESVWLELTAAGFWASPIGQLIEVRGTHERLRAEFGLRAFPQLLLRVGRAPEVPLSRRRPERDVIAE